jgi:eukaryotic-like serine/threonine-protein kinase
MIPEPAVDRLAAMLRAPDLTGTRYELISTLGRGGMGVVYLARDTALEREVALKIFDRCAGDANEARIIARLEHPGIVPVHDFGELPDGRFFYAMKRVRGDRLDRWMAAGRGITDRLAVFLRVCEAVAFAHAHGVVHRDLKPENVMVGEFGEVLVLDWGAAADRDIADCGLRSSTGSGRPEALEGRISDSKTIVGTPDYMAPEQARGDALIDQRADVFALGAMLAGIARGIAPLAAIASKAGAADAAQRYQSVPALAADVNRYLAGRAVEAHREPLFDRVSRVARRNRLAILLVLTYLVVRIALIFLFRV